MFKRLILLGIDIAIVAVASVLALLLRDNFEFSEPHLAAFLPYLAVTLAVSATLFAASGASWSIWRTSALKDYINIATSSVIAVLLTVAIVFSMSRMDGVARTIPVLQVMSMIFLLVAVRLLSRLRHARRDRPKQLVTERPLSQRKSVLLLGTNRIAELYVRSVAELANDRIAIAGVESRRKSKVGRSFLSAPILGKSSELFEIVKDLQIHGVQVDEVCVALPSRNLEADERSELQLLETHTDIRVTFIGENLLNLQSAAQISLAATPHSRAKTATATDASFVVSEAQVAAQRRRWFWTTKRIMDATIAFALIVAFSPVIIIVAALALLDVGMPIVFWQQRPGLGGRPFRLFKVRTMAAAHAVSGERLSDAERLSKVGCFLRATRFDELPQLFNILIGDMSFVGPRPLLPDDQPIGALTRSLVRPGLTGWAQVNGGRGISAADKIALDVWYIQNASLLLDVKILIATAYLVVFGERINGAAIRRAWSDLVAAGICRRPFDNQPGPAEGSQAPLQAA